MIFSEILIKTRNHSSRMRTDHTVTRPSSEPVFMRSIVDRQTPVKTLPSLAVGNQGPQPNLLHRITPHFGEILVPPPVHSHFQVYKHVSQLWAGGPVIPGSTSSGQGWTRSEHVPGCYGNPVYYGDEYSFYLWAGTHEPHQKVAGLVLSVLEITSWRAIWLSG